MENDGKAEIENCVCGQNRRTVILFEKHKWKKYRKLQKEVMVCEAKDERGGEEKDSAVQKTGVSRRSTVLFRKRKYDGLRDSNKAKRS